MASSIYLEQTGHRVSKRLPAGRIGDVTSTISGRLTNPKLLARLSIVSAHLMNIERDITGQVAEIRLAARLN
jgi:hypothetical protein